MLSGRSHGRPRLLFDLSHLYCAHNGTAKAAAAWLNALARRREFDVTAMGTREVARFHGVAPSIPLVPVDTRETFDAVFRAGQPFALAEIERISRLAPYQFHVMLDTIATDCLFSLETPELTPLWRFVADYSDGIVFISESSRSQFLRRFPPRAKTPALVCPLSLSAKDFGRGKGHRRGEGLLVLGNRFKHKFVEETVTRLAAEYPEKQITAFGLSGSRWPNVRAISSGRIDSGEVERLMREAEVVIYPSLYEGFGLPIAEALAWNKRVLARNLPSAREIARGWNGDGALELYDDTDALLRLLAKPGPCVLKRNARSWDWEDGAASLANFISRAMARDASAKVCRARLRYLDSLRGLAEPARVEIEKHRHGLATAERLRDITQIERRSERRVVGRVVDRVRHQLGRILYPVFYRQSEHNRAIGESVAYLSAKLDRLEQSSRHFAGAKDVTREGEGVSPETIS